MTIKEVCEQYDVSADTLRYYERVGVIPAVGRTAGGIRDYSEEDVSWISTAICLRSAGMSVERLVEYVRLMRLGDSTLQARCDLLKATRQEILDARAQYDTALAKLDYKISRYEEGIRTGVLRFDDCEAKK